MTAKGLAETPDTIELLLDGKVSPFHLDQAAKTDGELVSPTMISVFEISESILISVEMHKI